MIQTNSLSISTISLSIPSHLQTQYPPIQAPTTHRHIRRHRHRHNHRNNHRPKERNPRPNPPQQAGPRVRGVRGETDTGIAKTRASGASINLGSCDYSWVPWPTPQSCHSPEALGCQEKYLHRSLVPFHMHLYLGSSRSSTYAPRQSTTRLDTTHSAGILSLITARRPHSLPPSRPLSPTLPTKLAAKLILRSILQLHHPSPSALGFPHAHHALPAQKGPIQPQRANLRAPARLPITPVVNWPQPYPVLSCAVPSAPSYRRPSVSVPLPTPGPQAGASSRYRAGARPGTEGSTYGAI